MINNKSYKQDSIFKPKNLLREARRQKRIMECNIPKICVLDPDGDIVDYLVSTNKATPNKCWAGYHSTMHEFEIEGTKIGIIANAVGASFAVLLAEQMFVSGCELLISITSAGIINLPNSNPEYILITRALRDEGTSIHYLPASEFSQLPESIIAKTQDLIDNRTLNLAYGLSWTTDAPYRETPRAIQYAQSKNIHVVEMEAAALYAFAQFSKNQILCFAHATNTMAQTSGDFEKGEMNGSIKSIELIKHTIKALG